MSSIIKLIKIKEKKNTPTAQFITQDLRLLLLFLCARIITLELGTLILSTRELLLFIFLHVYAFYCINYYIPNTHRSLRRIQEENVTQSLDIWWKNSIFTKNRNTCYFTKISILWRILHRCQKIFYHILQILTPKLAKLTKIWSFFFDKSFNCNKIKQIWWIIYNFGNITCQILQVLC